MANLIAFLVLFGILVFVHELGHFLVAKYFKVGVEKFALGYGPRLFGKKVGETDYQICALPLGGFVKMVGDEPTDEQRATQQHTQLPENSFLAKPPLQRIAIVLAGPVANLLLPIALLFVINMVGQPNLASQVGYVGSNSAAKNAGLKAGDLITAVDGKAVREWSELTKAIETKANQPVQLSVARQGNSMETTVTPTLEDGLNAFGETVKVGRLGINPQSFTLQVLVPDSASAAAAAGLKSDDTIVAANGKPAQFLWQLEEAIRDNPSNITRLEVARGDKRLPIEVQRSLLLDNKQSLFLAGAGAYLKELAIEKVLPDSIAAEKGLRAGDVLVSINGEAVAGWFSFQEHIRANSGEALNLSVARGGKPLAIDISPRIMEQKEELTGEKYKQRMLGITTMGEVSMHNVFTQRHNPLKALAKSASHCYEISYLTIVGFGKLIAGQVSAKSLGGPILIYQLAGKSWKSGLHSFLNMLVLISITLGILNLLPIPVLDGGHLMFYGIELVKGSPVKPKTRERAQQVGVVMLLALMLFAFYNDLGRISWGELGWVNWLKDMFS